MAGLVDPAHETRWRQREGPIPSNEDSNNAEDEPFVLQATLGAHPFDQLQASQLPAAAAELAWPAAAAPAQSRPLHVLGPVATLPVLEQHRVASDMWSTLRAMFGGDRTPPSNPSTALFQTTARVTGTHRELEVLYTPVIPSHRSAADVYAARQFRDSANDDDGHLDEAMLLGLQRIFEQHFDYFLRLAPNFVTDGGRSGLLGPSPMPATAAVGPTLTRAELN